MEVVFWRVARKEHFYLNYSIITFTIIISYYYNNKIDCIEFPECEHLFYVYCNSFIQIKYILIYSNSVIFLSVA